MIVRIYYNVTYVGGILQGSLDDGLAEEHVSTAGTPQHPLEGRQTLAQDHSSHEANYCVAGEEPGMRLEGVLGECKDG